MTAQFVRLQVAFLVFAWFSLAGMGTRLAQAEDVSDSIATLERRVHELVNAHRAAKGLEPLNYSEQVALVARGHSRDMARGVVGMGHEGAEGRSATLARIVTYTQFAENVGVNTAPFSSTARTVVTAWLNSPPHRRNIERDVDLTGIGIARNGDTFFFTQLFLSTRSSARSLRPPRGRSRDFAPASDSSAAEKKLLHLSGSSEESPWRNRSEADPRKRAGRKRVGDGWVQELEKEP